MSEIDLQRVAYERLAFEPGFIPFRFNCGKLAGGHYQAVTWGNDRRNDGVADLGVLVYGILMIWIELKQPGKKQSKTQRDFEGEIKSVNGYYFVARSMGDIEFIISYIQNVFFATMERLSE